MVHEDKRAFAGYCCELFSVIVSENVYSFPGARPLIS